MAVPSILVVSLTVGPTSGEETGVGSMIFSIVAGVLALLSVAEFILVRMMPGCPGILQPAYMFCTGFGSYTTMFSRDSSCKIGGRLCSD